MHSESYQHPPPLPPLSAWLRDPPTPPLNTWLPDPLTHRMVKKTRCRPTRTPSLMGDTPGFTYHVRTGAEWVRMGPKRRVEVKRG